MAKKKNQIPYYLRPLTLQQLRAEANKETQDVLGPQIEQQHREAASRAATIQAASEAASKLLASHVGLTQQGYDTAAEELKSLGSGVSDQMKARIAAAQKAASDFGAQQGQTGPTSAVDATGVGDTVYAGGVSIPGSSLASQGAAATALENAQSGIPLLQGAQDERQSAMDEEKALLELAQKRPDLHNQIMDALYKNEMSKLSARIQQQAQDLYGEQFGEKVAHDAATEAAARDRNKISYQRMINSHQEAIAKATAAGSKPNAALSKAYGYIVDGDGNPILDKNGAKIPVAKDSSAKSKSAKSNAQYQKAVGTAEEMYTNAQPGPPDQYGDPTPAKRPWKWGEALNYLMNRYGIQRSRARQALIAAGFKPPSGRGRDGAGPQ